MRHRPSPELLDVLRRSAPGTALRDGLDRIIQSKMGALVVIDDGPVVRRICSGGFELDAPFTPQRLAELAKMDGAIILSRDAHRIHRANVHLVPDPTVETSETGTRHRTAERVGRSLSVPVISVSEERSVITIYRGPESHNVEDPARLIVRSNQALQTLERYRARLDVVMTNLSSLEVEDLATLRDMLIVLQRLELVSRIAAEIELDISELGDDGRLVQLQLGELMLGVEDERELLIRDYFHEDADWHVAESLSALDALGESRLLELAEVAEVLHLPGRSIDLDASVTPRGYRLLSRVPRLPDAVIERVVTRFGDLPHIIRATTDELEKVGGVGASRARSMKDALARITESSILGTYR